MSKMYYGEETRQPVANPKTRLSPTFVALQELIAEVTGNDSEEITPTTYMEEFHPADIPQMVNNINQHFGVRLAPKQVLDECETIDELVALIEDEQELG